MSATLAAYRMAWAELRESPRLYFWTATFVQALPVWQATPAWNWAWRHTLNFFGRIQGIRVAEWHTDHGIHFHFVVNVRMPVAVVRRIFQRYGFGRVNVQVVRCPRSTARYLESYLNKGEPLGHGLRRYARLGGIGVPVKDLVCESDLAKLCRKAVAETRAYYKRPLTRSEQFKAMRQARHAYEASFFDRTPKPGEFILHNGREITLQDNPPTARKTPRPRNSWVNFPARKGR